MPLPQWAPDDEISSERLNAMIDAIDEVVTGVFDSLNVDSGVLFVDATNNRVGINDTTPSVALDVTGAVAASQGTADTYTLSVTSSLSGATGNKLVKATDNSGATQFEVATLGSGSSVIAAYAPKATFGNVRNWNTNQDVVVANNRLTGNPTGSFVPLVVSYNAASQPSDGSGGVTDIPDEVAISVTAFAYNTAAGASQNYDGGLRAAELQTVIMENTGLSRNANGIEVGIYTAKDQTSNFDDGAADATFGSVGLFVHSDDITGTYAGFGTSTQANVGVLIGGTAPGGVSAFKQFILGYDTSGDMMWQIDENGDLTVGNIVPRTTGLTVGGASDRFNQIWGNTIVTNQGTTALPSLAVGLNAIDGFSAVALTSLSASINGGLAWTTSVAGFSTEAALIPKAIADPAAPAAGYHKWFTSTDGFAYAEDSSGRIRALTANNRDLFLAELLGNLAGVVLIYLPAVTDTTTSTDQSSIGSTITHSATVAGRLVRQGVGYGVTHVSASSQFSSLADASWFSFSNGSADSAFTLLVLANVTNTAAQRALISKWNTGQREWMLTVESDDTLRMTTIDESAGASNFRNSNAAVTQGSYRLFGMSYDGGGNASGITLYQDGTAIASTATEDSGGSYTAMDPGTGLVLLGGLQTGTGFLDGSIAFAAVVPAALTATQHAMIRRYVNWFFGLSL